MATVEGKPLEEQMTTDDKVNFDARFQPLMEAFSKHCDELQVPLAVAIILDPKIQETPLVYLRGHEYDVATLMAEIMRSLKDKLYNRLVT